LRLRSIFIAAIFFDKMWTKDIFDCGHAHCSFEVILNVDIRQTKIVAYRSAL